MALVIEWRCGEEINRTTRDVDAETAFGLDVEAFKELGYFVEEGYDEKRKAFWIILNCGDNCHWYYEETETAQGENNDA